MEPEFDEHGREVSRDGEMLYGFFERVCLILLGVILGWALFSLLVMGVALL